MVVLEMAQLSNGTLQINVSSSPIINLRGLNNYEWSVSSIKSEIINKNSKGSFDSKWSFCKSITANFNKNNCQTILYSIWVCHQKLSIWNINCRILLYLNRCTAYCWFMNNIRRRTWCYTCWHCKRSHWLIAPYKEVGKVSFSELLQTAFLKIHILSVFQVIDCWWLYIFLPINRRINNVFCLRDYTQWIEIKS